LVFNATFNNSSVISWCSVYWWRKPEYKENATDLSQVTDKLHHKEKCHIEICILCWQVDWILKELLFCLTYKSGSNVLLNIFVSMFPVWLFNKRIKTAISLVIFPCDEVCQWLATGRWHSPCTPVSSTNKLSTTWICFTYNKG
jgi:hypothetical protein